MTHNHIVHRLISELKTSPSNARTHSDKQVGQIADSIRSFGFNNPVLIDGHDIIIAGHGRVRAAAKLGMEVVPTLLLDHLSEAQKRAYILADNRLAELAGWDKEILAIELQNLLLEVALPLAATTRAYCVAGAVLEIYACALGCERNGGSCDLVAVEPLGPQSILAVHNEGDPQFESMGRGYPPRFAYRE